MDISAFIGKTVLVRDNKAGIHVGTLESLDVQAKACVLKDARKVWYWSGAASCHGIAVNGINQSLSKVAPKVEIAASFEVVEVIMCSQKGTASVMEAPEWKP